MKVLYYGNKHVLDWEEDRLNNENGCKMQIFNLPKQFKDIDDINYPVIVKSLVLLVAKDTSMRRIKKIMKIR